MNKHGADVQVDTRHFVSRSYILTEARCAFVSHTDFVDSVLTIKASSRPNCEIRSKCRCAERKTSYFSISYRTAV